MPGQSPSKTAQKDMQDAGYSAFSNDLLKFRKLKDEVVKNAQSYIRRCATIIFCTLSPDHEAVKCLSAFGDQAQKFAAEVLAIIEWGTQHWKFQETFPVPVIPRWLRMPEFTQTTTPLRGELPLMPTGSHIEDIRVRCPAMWPWMAILLQYWQDHMTPCLYLAIADSKEAAAKNLPPERQAAHVERQASATPRKIDVSSTSMSATLYPDWVLSRAGKRSSLDTPQLYRTPREGAGRHRTLEEELDASSVFDPLQSSQGAEGPRNTPHYSEALTNIPPFDIAKVGVLPRMSPITDQENALLNIAPGSPVRCAAPPGLDRGQGGSGRSSCSDSPMSLGSLAPRLSLGLALKVHTRPVTPSMFGVWEGLPRSTVEEDEEEMDATGSDDADQAQD